MECENTTCIFLAGNKKEQPFFGLPVKFLFHCCPTKVGLKLAVIF